MSTILKIQKQNFWGLLKLLIYQKNVVSDVNPRSGICIGTRNYSAPEKKVKTLDLLLALVTMAVDGLLALSEC